MKFIYLQILIKTLWCKLNCVCEHHTWSETTDMAYGIFKHFAGDHRQSRFCIYCGKYQYRESSATKEFSQIYTKSWEDFSFPYETDTQKVYKRAKKLSKDALFVSDELSKFDSCVKQKTKTFMHLVNAAKRLSKEFMDLKTEIRELHVEKQKDDINEDKSN